jgi:hypothetical protein
VITRTVWADSAAIAGGDSVFFLNRVMCDTCVTYTGDLLSCDTCYWAKNQPQFMMRKKVKMQSGMFAFMDTANFVIDPNALIGNSWVFDTLNNITALVINANVQNVSATPTR